MSAHCNWPLCVDRAEAESPWCAQHRLLAVQHDTSHELEGHSHAVPGCPRCEDPDGWARATETSRKRSTWRDQCPRRGPTLTHARTREDALDICVHCGLRIT